MKAREKKNKWWERKGDAMGMAEKHGREDRDNACNNYTALKFHRAKNKYSFAFPTLFFIFK